MNQARGHELEAVRLQPMEPLAASVLGPIGFHGALRSFGQGSRMGFEV